MIVKLFEKIPLRLFNTKTRSMEEVKPIDGKKIRYYTCGPTVYDYAHIGNFRTFVFEDILRRSLRFFGFEVEQVMNLTDVDDKTIKGALAKNIALNEFTAIYKKAFFEDIAQLNIEPVEHYPCATDYIQEMIAMCQELLEKKVAYKGSDGSIYFAISEFKEYGKLSHLHLEDLQKGAREQVAQEQVVQDEYGKEHYADFVLWKAYDPKRDGNFFWESPFGRGRPGWHLECSVMAKSLLGESIDIHAGGVDLIFPHHENEIAQSESCSGKCFSKLWVHAEHLLIDGKKMSKSLGNFYTLRDLLEKGYTGKAIRLLLAQSHYRTPINFTLQALDAAKHALDRLNDFVLRLESYEGPIEPKESVAMADFLQEAMERFTKALASDLNLSEALSIIFDMIREVHGFCDHMQITTNQAKEVLELLKQMDQVFGVCSFTHEAIPEEIQKLSDLRQEARLKKDFKQADLIRNQIAAKGYILEDTASGIRIKKK